MACGARACDCTEGETLDGPLSDRRGDGAWCYDHRGLHEIVRKNKPARWCTEELSPRHVVGPDSGIGHGAIAARRK
jgi:hypothetical protein